MSQIEEGENTGSVSQNKELHCYFIILGDKFLM